ncbi:MAG: hypothetical protein QM765_33940 [Myxococcales bacterium]
MCPPPKISIWRWPSSKAPPLQAVMAEGQPPTVCTLGSSFALQKVAKSEPGTESQESAGIWSSSRSPAVRFGASFRQVRSGGPAS